MRPGPDTRRQLRTLNREFYGQVASEFDTTRNHPWPGWEELLGEWLDAQATSPLRVLDLACGNGRFARWLSSRHKAPLEYLGLDENPDLLSAAQQSCQGLCGIGFARAELLEDESGGALPRSSHDLIVAFGLLHHIPGFEARVALLRAALWRLAPGGRLGVSLWQFADHERFARRRLTDLELRARGISTDDLEPGDWVLGWGNSEANVRYCHHIGDDEALRLLEFLQARCLLDFRADGREARLNRYWLLENR